MADQLPDFEGDAGTHLEATPCYAMSMAVPDASATSGQDVSVSTGSSSTSQAIGSTTAVVYSDVLCFAAKGASPTATVVNGVPIPAACLVRVYGFAATDKLAFITPTGTGTVRVRPSL